MFFGKLLLLLSLDRRQVNYGPSGFLTLFSLTVVPVPTNGEVTKIDAIS